MKSGKTPQQFFDELNRRKAASRDFLAPASQLSVLEDNRIALQDLAYGMDDNFQSQAAGVLDFPFKFWQRARDQYPDQWRGMVNAMFSARDTKHLIRTYDGNARAFLSDRYRRIDNIDVATVALQAISDVPGWQVVSAEVTDRQMYIKVLTPLIKEVTVGNPVQSGFIIRNSEVGLGSYDVESLLYFLRCTNGMIGLGGNLRRTHLGARLEGGDDKSYELFSNETKRLTDAALMSQTRDVIRATADEMQFSKVIAKLADTKTREIVSNDVPKVVEVTAKNYGLNDGESNAVLRNLIEGADLSQWGLFNAVTLAAHQDDEMSYERSIELEKVGGAIAALDPKQWIDITAVK